MRMGWTIIIKQSHPADALPARPQSARHQQPVGQREDESLHEVKLVAGLLLIAVEGLVDGAVVLELGQHQLQLADEQRATRVAGIAVGEGRSSGVFADC
jgi:hypothetical protein